MVKYMQLPTQKKRKYSVSYGLLQKILAAVDGGVKTSFHF